MKLIEDVGTIEGASKATKAGMWGSFAFAAFACLGIALGLSASSEGVRIGTLAPIDVASFVASAAFEMVVALVAAFRFRKGKGWLIGSIALAIYIVETVTKVISGFGIGWFLLYAAIILALVNGIRGAWALRKPEELAGHLHETFN